ncbi:hypothetical protein IJ090_01340 [Candidatus Saccharibacteria bacterium]|nr:hypothetical protein [Candidatus Saccharibacteria bacterium]
MNLDQISGLGPYTVTTESLPDQKSRLVYKPKDSDRAFLVENPHTIEFRTDQKLGKLLAEKYESVMKSRYFGKNGLELVPSGQLAQDEIEDLIRLSYNLSKK